MSSGMPERGVAWNSLRSRRSLAFQVPSWKLQMFERGSKKQLCLQEVLNLLQILSSEIIDVGTDEFSDE
ncbi:hypothetical protein TNCV_4837751 [Trichonephila clavipes]|nr:hypothetical protein TNCV_4837751 [Trichonephila clavipes]